MHRNVVALLRACDIVFGTTSIALALFGLWLYHTDRAHVSTVLALWFIPLFNLAWSRLSRSFGRVHADLLRTVFSVPVAAFLYVAETGTGSLARLWFPSLILLVGCCLSLGIGTRRPFFGYLVTSAYGLAIPLASVLVRGHVDVETVGETMGLVVTGLVFSQIAGHFGRSLDEAREQRDSAHHQKEQAEAVAALLEHSSSELVRTLDSLRIEIEQRARIESELRQSQKLEAVGRLAAGVAHEINTPVQFVQDNVHFVLEAMTDVFGLVDELGVIQRSVIDAASVAAANRAAERAAEDADLPYLVEHVPRALASAVEGLKRIAAIVRSMKEFAHPDARKMAEADLNRAIQSTLTMASTEYKYVAEMKTDLADLPLVWCHVGELNQAVLNIVVNAAHAIGDVVAGTDRKGRIHVRTYRDDNDVVIAIADTGSGMSAEVSERIFDPFYTTKEVGRGTGQGLAIARSVIVDKHGGKLWLETEIGKGTTFFIRLPIHARTASMVSAGTEAAGMTQSPTSATDRYR